MKRSFAVGATFALLLAACGGGSESDAGAAAASTTPTVPTATTLAAVTTTTTVAPSTTSTVAPTTTTTAAAGIVPGEDPDVDAIVLAYTVAFDSVSDFEAKAQYIDDPSGLEDTVAQYLITGETMGGIGVEVSEVTVEGDTATLIYDLLFNDNPTYPDLTGRAVLTDAGWQIPRSAFCSLMSSARVGCPDS
ncbi:MAG: hypothetical protein ACN4GK_12435 [Acidimicrobiia bacterium]